MPVSFTPLALKVNMTFIPYDSKQFLLNRVNTQIGETWAMLRYTVYHQDKHLRIKGLHQLALTFLTFIILLHDLGRSVAAVCHTTDRQLSTQRWGSTATFYHINH